MKAPSPWVPLFPHPALDNNSAAGQLNACGRLAFCRVTLCEEALSVALWAVAIAGGLPLPLSPSPSPSSPVSSKTGRRSPRPERTEPPARALADTAPSAPRIVYDFKLDVDRVGLVCSSASRDAAGHDDRVPLSGGTLLRLSIPRLALRASSGPNEAEEAPEAATPSGPGDAGQAARGEGQGRAGSGASEPRVSRVSVSAEWLEGHLEVGDPGDGMSSATPEEEGVGAGSPAPPLPSSDPEVPGSNDRRRTKSEIPSSSRAISDDPVGAPSGSEEEVPMPVPRSGSALLPRRSGGHRLRCLVARKVSVAVRPSRRSGGRAAGLEITASTPEDDGGAEGDNGSVQEDDGLGDRCQPGAGGGAAAGPLVAVEGLWAEWTPALFFVLGRSGAMVSNACVGAFVELPALRQGLVGMRRGSRPELDATVFLFFFLCSEVVREFWDIG